jgi:ABC-type branched-subunit amino acid transport system substrate-binding protein
VTGLRSIAIVTALVAMGCHGKREVLGPGVPASSDPVAKARFNEAKAKFLEDSKVSAEEFKRLIEDFPHDPIVPLAEVYAGYAQIKAHKFADADVQLTKAMASPDLLTHAKAQLFLAIAKNYEGDPATAWRLLTSLGEGAANNCYDNGSSCPPFVRPFNLLDTDDERGEYLAAYAYSAPNDAGFEAFESLWTMAVTPVERSAMVTRIEEICATLTTEQLQRAYRSYRHGPTWAIAGSQLAVRADQTGETAAAAKLRAEVADVRVKIGLSRTIAGTAVGITPGGGNPGLVGAVVPLGTQNRIADAAVAGLGLAAGAPNGSGVAAIEVRPAGDKAEGEHAVDELAGKNVIAIIGPIEGSVVDAAGGRAEGLGVPMISLATAADQRLKGRFVFHIRHSAEARARTLAQRALAKGVHTFAVFAPENGYGKAVTAAFVDQIQKGGGTITKTVTYAKDTKSFASKAKELGTQGWQAVFVPDTAAQLALAAPAIAAAGNVPKAMPFPKKVLGGRPILLLSTAEDLSNDFLTSAGRHAEGALFAPGFYPDDADPIVKPFIDKFVMAYGHVPGAGEAYAYDAAQLVVAGAANDRAGLATAIARGQLAGVTGTVSFDVDHHRSDAGIVYTVVEETGSVYAIRIAK